MKALEKEIPIILRHPSSSFHNGPEWEHFADCYKTDGLITNTMSATVTAHLKNIVQHAGMHEESLFQVRAGDDDPEQLAMSGDEHWFL